MRIEARALSVCSVLAAPAAAQNAPLSVIDWLNEAPVAIVAPSEEGAIVVPPPPVPDVSVAPLETETPRRVGLIPVESTGFPEEIWAGSSGDTLSTQIGAVPDLTLPAAQALFHSLLLTEADPPRSAADAFDLARVDALARRGALDPALALLEEAGPTATAAHLARYFDLTLIAGVEDRACAALRAAPRLGPGEAQRVFCAARYGDWETAALILGTADALDLIAPGTADALARFLDPDLFEGEPPLPLPQIPDPLLFRVFEAIGQPIATSQLPRVYANAALDDRAGWKAQLVAAERLALSGALPENKLLGLYTARQPAASGGIWDRVAAVQRFETALGTRSLDAIQRSLPPAWTAMRAAGLHYAFSVLFADSVDGLDLSGPAEDAAFEILLLSPLYERAAISFPDRARDRPLLAAIAAGETSVVPLPPDPLQAALHNAFSGAAEPDPALLAPAQRGAVGEALLAALAAVHDGASGDAGRLPTALATLRALGLEDTARRAALQIALMDRPT